MLVKIGNLVDLSLVDVLFHPAFVIWFSGCNFRCPWCSAAPLVKGEGEFIEIDEIIKQIERVKFLVDYVQVTGGEPTLQPEAVRTIFIHVRELGLKTSLDTNASRPEVIEQLVREGLIDHLATDLKTNLVAEKYAKVIGLEDATEIVKAIERSYKLIAQIDFLEIRTTYVPSLITIEDMIAAVERAKQLLGRDDFYYMIQQFFPFEELLDPNFKDVLISHKELLELGRQIKDRTGLKRVFVRSKAGIEEVF